MRAVPFYLLVGGDGAEDDFGELAGVEGPVGYSSRQVRGVGGRCAEEGGMLREGVCRGRG